MTFKTKNFDVYPSTANSHTVVVTNSERLAKKLNRMLNYPYDRKTAFDDVDEPKFKVSNDMLNSVLKRMGVSETILEAHG